MSSANGIVSLPCSTVSIGCMERDAIFSETIDRSGVSSVSSLADCITCLAPDAGGVEGELFSDSRRSP